MRIFLTVILLLSPLLALSQTQERMVDVISADYAQECSLPVDSALQCNDYDYTVSTLPAPTMNLYNPYKFKSRDLIAPGLFLGLGIAGLEWKGLKKVNQKIEDALWNGREKQFRIDQVTPFLAPAAVYGLKLCGVKGLHDYADITIIMGTAYLMAGVTGYALKDFVNEVRPNGESFNSFPSGHTMFTFVGAEILRREYWNVSPWIGISGYLIAAGTGFMRMYNGAHWLTDVLAGAGIGILSAEAAYWLYPIITKALFPKQYNSNMFIAPTAGKNAMGLAVSISF